MRGETTVNSNGAKDNRQAVRVTSRLLFSSHVVSAEKYEEIHQDINNGISLYNREELADIQVYIGAQSALSKLKEKDNDLATFLQHLDGKLNMLLSKINDGPDLMDSMSLQTVSLGGNGLAFWSDDNFAPNDILELRIVLQPEHVFVNCFGQVVDSKKESKLPEAKKRISVRFKLIMDSDREILIQHNFKQQSLALKRRRLEKEGKGG